MIGIGRRRPSSLGSWARMTLILTPVVLTGIWEEMRVLGPEFMMFVRWTRDAARYQVRWVVQEKVRRIVTRHRPSVED